MVSRPQVSVVPEQVAVDEAASLDERWARAPNNTGFSLSVDHRRRTAPRPEWRERSGNPLRIDLVERLCVVEPRQAMPAETAETNARQLSIERTLRLTGDDDLAPVGRGANPSCGVDGQTDVPRLRKGGAATVDTGTKADRDVARPRPFPQTALDGESCFDGRNDTLEDREELVGSGVDLTAARPKHGLSNDVSTVVKHARIAIAKPAQMGG